MIQIVPCRQCNKTLLLPANVSLRATLSCPQCGERVVLGEFLESSFGYWNVVEDPLADESSVVSSHAAADSDEGDQRLFSIPSTYEPSLASVESKQDDGQELELEEASGHSISKSRPQADVQPITHEQFERIKRKQRSPIWGILQVALGGIAAVPIALLILWHLLGKDIAGAGPAVAVYAPWIVPKQFRPIEEESSANTPPRSRGESGFRNFDDVMPWDDADSTLPGTDSATGSRDGVKTRGGLEADIAGAPFDPRTSSDANSSYGENVAGPGEKGFPGQESKDKSGLGSPASPDTRNILLLVERCRQNLSAWQSITGQQEAADAASKRRLAQELYGDLTDLSAVVSTLPEGTPIVRAIRNSLQPLGRSIKSVPGAQQVIEQGARHWLDTYPDQSTLPLALIVEIEKVDEEEQGWVVQPTAGSLPDAIDKVVVPSVLAPSLIPGQRLFLLGQINSQISAANLKPSESEIVEIGGIADADKRLSEDGEMRQPWFKASYLYGL